MVKLIGKLPTENGLDQVAQMMVESPEQTYLVVGKIRVAKIVTVLEDKGSGELARVREPVVGFTSLELVSASDALAAGRLLAAGARDRTGQRSLFDDDGGGDG